LDRSRVMPCRKSSDPEHSRHVRTCGVCAIIPRPLRGTFRVRRTCRRTTTSSAKGAIPFGDDLRPLESTSIF
jgi:hypothetical protein